jgi:nicotinamidase-related amidase
MIRVVPLYDSRHRILVRDTWNTDIVPELTTKPGDVVMYKHRFSGFYGTERDVVLKRAGVKDLIVTGCTTSVCVESSRRDVQRLPLRSPGGLYGRADRTRSA